MDWQMHCKGHSINEVGGHRVNQVSFLKLYSNTPKGRVPRALPVGEWEIAHRASSIACVLERVPRALPTGIYISDCFNHVNLVN